MTRRHTLARALVFALILTVAPLAEARADFLVSPFIGAAFGGKSTVLDLDLGAVTAKHWTFGANATWLSDQIFGLEADVATVPGFFQNPQGLALVTSSRVTTISGNVLVAVPLAISRESLRPYILGGLGLIRLRTDDRVGLVEGGEWPGLQIGGGAIGFISKRTGIRFDLRHNRALSRGVTPRGERTSRLSFWRASIGVTIRY